jgi:hypothetical protein
MQRYGGMVWGVHTAQLASSLAAIQRERDVTKKDGVRINKERKSYQVSTSSISSYLLSSFYSQHRPARDGRDA